MKQDPHRVKILGAEAVRAKLRRMAYEMFEKNYEAEELIMVGLGGRGRYLAEELSDILKEISPLKVQLYEAGKGEEGITFPTDVLQAVPGKVVVIVDDVLYSGLTMFQALSLTMEQKPSRVQIAVLIDRGHRNIPVGHDFVGMELATSLQQYVSVEIEETAHEAEAFLF